MTKRTKWFTRVLWAVIGCGWASSATAADFEVWLIDQSNSPGKTYGGKAYIWHGADLMGASASQATPTDTIDLGEEAAELCLAQTGAYPVRPHMLVFNNGNTHAALAFVASGHVLFMDTATRRPVACLRTSPGVGGARQAHAAWPTPDDRFLIVANQNGKQMERINTNYATSTFVHDTAATLNLATCTTPSGLPCEAPGLRPDNAPLCPFVPATGGPTFISLRGGGLFLLDAASTPMSIKAEYDTSAVSGNGCGFIEARGWVYLNAGGGTSNHLDGFEVYRLPAGGYPTSSPPNTPPVQHLFSDPEHHRDAHGVATTRHQRYVWMFDRAANFARVFDSLSGVLVHTVDLTSSHSADPTPDLAAVSPCGNRMFLSLRGPSPLSGDPHASTGSTPGLGVVQVTGGGVGGFMKSVVRISNLDGAGVERADAHGIRVRLRN